MSQSSKRASNPNGRPRLSAGPIILIGAGVLILLAVLVFQLSNLPTTTAPQSSAFSEPYPEVVRVSLADAKIAFDNHSAVFLDVRDNGTYGSDHISGALNIPLADLPARMSELPKDRWIITYCT